MTYNVIKDMLRRIADLERRQNNVLRPAKVAEVDAKKGLVKVQFSKTDDGEPVLSPWIPWVERAGNLKTWSPPTKGEQVQMFSPSGEIGLHSWVLNGGFSSQFPQPHDKENEHKFVVEDGEGNRTELLMTPRAVKWTAPESYEVETQLYHPKASEKIDLDSPLVETDDEFRQGRGTTRAKSCPGPCFEKLKGKL